jgi:import inner membrane translocase subunit TIM21
VTATETVSYSLVILAGLGVAAAAAWAVLKELVFEPKEYAVYGLALERCRVHAVVGVRLGEPLTGYGVEGGSRSARQRIRHKLGRDAEGRETVTVQFQLRGPRGVGTVLAEARADAAAPGGWAFNYLQVQDATGSRRYAAPHRLTLLESTDLCFAQTHPNNQRWPGSV